ncbi:MAG: hypothetical protein LIO74_12375, partial [Ruminococcus sp.]|nr:hypothetical protein [Ruminococcus sp.]
MASPRLIGGLADGVVGDFVFHCYWWFGDMSICGRLTHFDLFNSLDDTLPPRGTRAPAQAGL